MADNEKTDIEKLQDGLDYLSQTKDLIKQAIVSKGQTIGNDTTFREYAQKISDIETGVDTSDATATAQDICGNKTAYARGQKLTGQIPMYDPNTGAYVTNSNTLVDNPSGNTPSIYVENNQNYKVAFANGAGFEVSYSTLASFIGLVNSKIKSGETILGITGNYTGIDTSDATATAGDIIKDKTAYVNGQKITGILEISSGGPIKKDVNFYDYDGTLLYSYTKAEFLALDSLPANSSHTGLTSQGWNWTLVNAQTYVTNYGKLNIGQTYITDDNSTRIYITLKERLEPYLGFLTSGSVTIDWGDGNTETITTTGSTVTFVKHTYSNSGDYVIRLYDNSNKLQIYGFSSSTILTKNGTSSISNEDSIYQNSVKKVEIGSNTAIGQYAFCNCNSLLSITIPNGVTSIGNNAFQNCYALSNIVIPDGVTTLYGSICMNCYSLLNISLPYGITSINVSDFQNCYALTSITIPDSATLISSYAFYYCYSLLSVVIPNSITGIYDSAFQNCYALSDLIISNTLTTISSSTFRDCKCLLNLTIPDSVTTINQYAFTSCFALSVVKMSSNITSISMNVFQYCYGVVLYDFSECLQVPSLGHANSFGGIPSDCKIVVPDSLYEDWIVANVWSNFASHIVKASEYNQ